MSIVITPETKSEWTNALNKARAVKPQIKVIGHGRFEVTGSEGTKYQVIWTARKGQDVQVSCTCPAHTAKDKEGIARPRPCYHIPPTSALFKQQVAERANRAAYALTFIQEVQSEVESERAALAAYNSLSDGTGAYVECRQCGEEHLEADMLGPGYNPICPNCYLFGR